MLLEPSMKFHQMEDGKCQKSVIRSRNTENTIKLTMKTEHHHPSETMTINRYRINSA
jgi:hypothetical protein